LPAPFGPSSPSTPGFSSRLKRRSAHTFPLYRLPTFSIDSFTRGTSLNGLKPHTEIRLSWFHDV
jgi:hypothetical protein